MRTRRDIAITWPKTRSFDDYLEACRAAEISQKDINYRIAKPPAFDFGSLRDRPARVYVIHDGFVRGYHELKLVTFRGDNEVLSVDGRSFWPRGWYLVRDPQWNEIQPIPMRGFQGWRYYP